MTEILHYLAIAQCEIRTIKETCLDQWDATRVMEFTHKLAIRSRAKEFKISEKEAAYELEHTIAYIHRRDPETMIQAYINRMDAPALEALAKQLTAWREQLTTAADDASPLSADPDMLSADAVEGCLVMIRAAVEAKDPTDLELLQHLNEKQKRQIMGCLAREEIAKIRGLQVAALGSLQGSFNDPHLAKLRWGSGESQPSRSCE